ncbi:uncharacterized protein LOC124455243 [Xenia sp. Carnegie-2017]|uniref:uncharacterized protein LOC124455243 n=1 Tax=Xenia sp. Carnegie-2017 TaxID=2897299 RepID=UPI001F03F470|nr:uncharacterized protein LOC124455243 [Xenia sp. Carnegie-2017]
MKILDEINDEIIGICDVTDIEHEIEEAAAVSDRILSTRRKIEGARKPEICQETIKRRQSPTPQVEQIPLVVATASTSNTTISNDENNTYADAVNTNTNAVNTNTNAVNTNTNAVNTNTNTVYTNTNAIDTITNEVINANSTILNAPVRTTPAIMMPKLPKLQLPKFSGKITEWNAFGTYTMLRFTATRCSTFDKGLTLTSANYDAAIAILQDRFGRTQQVIAAHMDQILQISACSENRTGQLRYVFDQISVQVRGLDSLGVSANQYGSLLIPIIMSKLPSEIRLQVARKATGDVWQIEELLKTIKFEVEAREMSESSRSIEKPQNKDKPNKPSTAGTFVVTKMIKTVPIASRLNAYTVKDHIIQHLVKSYPATNSQGVQNEKAIDNTYPQKVSEGVNSPTTTAVTRTVKGSVLLQTARALVSNGSKSVPARILFDTGSQRSYIRRSLQGRLRLNSIGKETLQLNTFGQSKSKRESCEVFKVSIANKSGGEVVEIKAIAFPTICAPLPTRINIDDYPHLHGLELADFDSSDNNGSCDSIDILIGADHYWDVVTGDVVRGENGPTAMSSKLGWLLSGWSSQKSDEHTLNSLILAADCLDNSTVVTDRDELTISLKRFGKLRTLALTFDSENSTEEQDFVRNIQFTGTRYEVGLPWKNDHVQIDDDYELCHNRLRSLHRKLLKDPQNLEEYNNGITEQLAAGIVERVPASDKDCGKIHYLPIIVSYERIRLLRSYALYMMDLLRRTCANFH